MKVLYVGSLYPKGWVPTARMRMEELRKLGHQILPVDIHPFYLWGGPWIAKLSGRAKWGPPIWRLNRTILAQTKAGRPGILWVDKGIWVYRRTLRRVREMGVKYLVHYTPDPAFVTSTSRHFAEAIPEYDLLITTKKYEEEAFRKHGARQLMLQYPSFDQDVHHPVTPSAEEARRFKSDAVFVGTYAPGREKYLRPLALAGFDLAIWGSYWDRCADAEVRRHVRGGPVGGRDYALALSCATMGLGLLSPLHPDRSTTRSLEIPACGTLLLAERTEEHEALFEDNREAIFFSSAEELIAKARHYLEHKEERNRIAAAGRERCLTSGYSSADRVKEIVDVIEEALGAVARS